MLVYQELIDFTASVLSPAPPVLLFRHCRHSATMGASKNNNNSQEPIGAILSDCCFCFRVKEGCDDLVSAAACEEGPGVCALALTIFSLLLILVSLPLSLLFVVKVEQEYERAVIFRLGRLLTGGARGPGVFFVIPCVDVYEKIDMRTQTFDVPPQEV